MIIIWLARLNTAPPPTKMTSTPSLFWPDHGLGVQDDETEELPLSARTQARELLGWVSMFHINCESPPCVSTGSSYNYTLKWDDDGLSTEKTSILLRDKEKWNSDFKMENWTNMSHPFPISWVQNRLFVGMVNFNPEYTRANIRKPSIKSCLLCFKSTTKSPLALPFFRLLSVFWSIHP